MARPTRSQMRRIPGLTTALGVALATAPAAAAVEFQPCPQPQADTSFGPWSCNAFIVGPEDLLDQSGNTAALDGDTMVLGYAGQPTLDRGEFVVLTRREWGWEERTRLPVRGRGEVTLRGDTIAIADASQIVTDTYMPPTAIRVYVNSDTWSPWVQRATITDAAWDATGGEPFVPAIALTDTILVHTTLVDDDDDACDVPQQGASIYSRTYDAWTLEATLAPDYDPCRAPEPALLAATDEHVVLAIGKSAHVFRQAGAVWSQVAVITPSEGAPEGGISGIAMSGERLVMTTSTPSDVDVLVHVYRFDGSVWLADTKLNVPQSPELAPPAPSVHVSGERVFVTTGELHETFNLGSVYVFRGADEWYEEARVRTVATGGNGWFAALSVNRAELLALAEPYSEPYFGHFELHVLEGAPSDPGTAEPLPNPCDDGACGGDVDPVVPGAEEDRDAEGCGCALRAGEDKGPTPVFLALVLLARARRRWPR